MWSHFQGNAQSRISIFKIARSNSRCDSYQSKINQKMSKRKFGTCQFIVNCWQSIHLDFAFDRVNGLAELLIHPIAAFASAYILLLMLSMILGSLRSWPDPGSYFWCYRWYRRTLDFGAILDLILDSVDGIENVAYSTREASTSASSWILFFTLTLYQNQWHGRTLIMDIGKKKE